MSQQYCLRWNNHQHNLLSVFEDLLHHEAFVDVTLACDGLQLKAHKMVLSACSPYFQSMLYGTPDRHPIVFLRDVRYHEMKALLEFMYRGEVSVDQDNLSSLLKVAEGLKIKGLAEVHEQKQQQQAAMAGLLTLQQSSPGAHMFSGLMSPAGGNPAGSGSSGNKRSGSPQPQSNNPQSSSQSAQYALGPKRKRGRPRRLSGSEAVPMASGMGDNTDRNEDLHVQTEDMNTKLKEEKGVRDGSGDVSPKDTKASDLISEADSNDGHASGVHSPRALDLSPPGGGANRIQHNQDRPRHQQLTQQQKQQLLLLPAGLVGGMSGGMSGNNKHIRLPPSLLQSTGQSPPPPCSVTPTGSISHHPGGIHPDDTEGTVSPPSSFLQQPPPSSLNAAAAFIQAATAAAAAAQANSQTSPTLSDHDQNNHNAADLLGGGLAGNQLRSADARPRVRNRRGGRGGRSARNERMSAAIGSGSPRSLSEMSVRGLDLLRYATLAPDGTYRCVECERVQILKHFKNKYSFQRHAFLYHEGASRKVFPCTVCQKEFSRPDKMKQHLKQAHDGHPKAALSGIGSRKSRAGQDNGNAPGNPLTGEGVAPGVLPLIIPVTGQGHNDDDLPPSTLLMNPFRTLSDPADMEGKISSIKESGSRC